MFGPGRHVDASEVNSPSIDAKRAGDGIEQPSISRSVGAYDDDERAFVNGKADILQRLDLVGRFGIERFGDRSTSSITLPGVAATHRRTAVEVIHAHEHPGCLAGLFTFGREVGHRRDHLRPNQREEDEHGGHQFQMIRIEPRP